VQGVAALDVMIALGQRQAGACNRKFRPCRRFRSQLPVSLSSFWQPHPHPPKCRAWVAAVLGIVFFLVIRPQQQKAKEFAAMMDKVRRGDTVVTAGGFVARVSKVTEGSDEIEVELSDTMKVRVLKSTLMSVRSKTEPVKAVS
jgi:preprotein translocase subunit YajC